jgi:hypothetical protein
MEIVATVHCLLHTTAKITSWVSAMRGAPSVACNVVTEAHTLQAIFHQLQDFIGDFLEGPNDRQSLMHVDQLDATLTDCVCTFTELEQILDKLHSDQNGGFQFSLLGRVRWSWKYQELRRILGDLQSHKVSLILMLMTITRYATVSYHLSVANARIRQQFNSKVRTPCDATTKPPGGNSATEYKLFRACTIQSPDR